MSPAVFFIYHVPVAGVRGHCLRQNRHQNISSHLLHMLSAGNVEVTMEVATPSADGRLRTVTKMEQIARGGIIGEAALVNVAEEANPRLTAAVTTERCVICTLDFAAFQKVLSSSPDMKKAVDGALASWRQAVKPRTLASHWLLAPLAAAAMSKQGNLGPGGAAALSKGNPSFGSKRAASFRGLKRPSTEEDRSNRGAQQTIGDEPRKYSLIGAGLATVATAANAATYVASAATSVATTAAKTAASAAVGAASAAVGVTGAALDATAQLLGVGDGNAGKKQKQVTQAERLLPVQQLVACCTTRIVPEGSAAFGPNDPPGAAIIVSGTLVEQTAAVSTIPFWCPLGTRCVPLRQHP